MINQDPREEAIRQAAAEWAVRLDAGALDTEQAQALEHWKTLDPCHAQALRFAQATWADLGRLEAMPVTAEAPPPHSLPKRSRSPLRWSAAIAALLLLALIGAEPAHQALVPLLADHAARNGQINRVRLPDGSLAELDAGSAIDLAYSENERRVRLLYGTAIFSVVPMDAHETRPFRVEYAGGTLQALGTRFVVGPDARGGAWIGVLEHRVALNLTEPPRKGVAMRQLQEGQSAHYDADSGISLETRDLRRAIDWQRGALVFERTQLTHVIERLNRYRPSRVLVARPALARHEVSGVFQLDDLDRALDLIVQELKAKRIDLPGLTLLY